MLERIPEVLVHDSPQTNDSESRAGSSKVTNFGRKNEDFCRQKNDIFEKSQKSILDLKTFRN